MLVNYGNILGQFGYGSENTYSPAKYKWHRDRDVTIMQYKA